ncbi:MAG TPA: sigma-54 dependent transcriptional regulator, partial [Gemmatimonadales bacterium]|nr:sigma-54 dependent transcriptional regulator [Gemmatimonadales bacterium]
FLGVGDEAVLRDLTRYARAESAEVKCTQDPGVALRAIATGGWSALLVVLGEDPEEQLAWWIEILQRLPRRPRVVPLVSGPSIAFTLRAAQLGIFDALPMPVERQRFIGLVRRIRAADEEVPLPLPPVRPIAVGAVRMVSESAAMLPVFRTIAQVAPSGATVLITGESGTGKDLVARALHQNSLRHASPFVAVNCAGIPETLLESELFGHEKGSFTGAIARKFGRFERASGGTLFLDELGDMSLALQSKILRAVQEREIERVGGSEPIPIDVRLIAATHRDLRTMIEEGRFREDLYYRLAVVTIVLPSLAEREEDLLVLTTSFLAEFGERYGKTFTGISDRAVELLRAHPWAGNVRELRNVIERAVVVADSSVLCSHHLPEEWRTPGVFPAAPAAPADVHGSLSEMEARYIAQVLDHTHGHIGEAARILGVHRNTLARKIGEYGL